MSRFAKCRTCKGVGFKDKGRTIICPDCGGGSARNMQRGHHTGILTKRRTGGNKFLCPADHLKTGITVDKDGNLYPYCEICHRDVVRKAYYKEVLGI